jgi:hypothetical protein
MGLILNSSAIIVAERWGEKYGRHWATILRAKQIVKHAPCVAHSAPRVS